MEKFECKHNITDVNVINRLNTLKPKFEALLQRNIENDEFIDMLDIAMNCDEMQIWLLENSFADIKTTEEQDLAKYFELNTDERIIINYRCMSNCNEENLNDVISHFQREKN